MVTLVSRTGRHLQRYNFHGHRQVVGCIPYRYKSNLGTSPMVDEEEIEVLVITSQRKGKGMLFPKHKLGKWNFKSKNNDTCYEGHMFPLLVKEQLEFWPEKDVRQRLWVSVREARKMCQYWWMKEALELLVNRLTTAQANVDQGRKSNL
ncbi:UNVERIFIED_CONTAM: Nudix hydrolase 21, chloroplastic [Sesamum radiatum]|uniref:Nudix hydrolase 21, chloroplastic n=1 Tax=Sesamum radiatum TaxID=300843 RepID=A0AAW2VML0_SESRA